MPIIAALHPIALRSKAKEGRDQQRGITHVDLGRLLADGEAAQRGGGEAVRVRGLLQAVLLADERPGGLHEVCTGPHVATVQCCLSGVSLRQRELAHRSRASTVPIAANGCLFDHVCQCALVGAL